MSDTRNPAERTKAMAAQVVLRPMRHRVVLESEFVCESNVTSLITWPISSYSGEGAAAAPKSQLFRFDGFCGPFRRRTSVVYWL